MGDATLVLARVVPRAEPFAVDWKMHRSVIRVISPKDRWRCEPRCSLKALVRTFGTVGEGKCIASSQ
jgi:hypothetical protein